jgi:hypothetical protein
LGEKLRSAKQAVEKGLSGNFAGGSELVIFRVKAPVGLA